MTSLIIFILLVYGLFLIFDINFKTLSNQSLDYLLNEKKINIRDNVKILKGKKKENIIVARIKKINYLLEITNRKKALPLIFLIAMILGIVGIGICITINNMYLLTILPLGLFLMPFIVFEGTINAYKMNINSEIEVVLSIINTSYLRTNDIIESVTENIEFMEEPIKSYFIDFLNDTVKTRDIEISLEKLKGKIENTIFKEWIDNIKACQTNHTLKTVLPPIVAKLSDIRIINDELDTMFSTPKRDFFSVCIISICIIPLISIINIEWFNNIFNTTIGKISLTIMIFTVFFSIYKVTNIVKPIEN